MDRIRRGVDLRPFNAAFFGFCTLAAHAVTSRLVLGLVGLGWALQLTFFRFVLVAALHTAAIFTYARLLTVGSDTRVVRWHVGYGAFLAATVASGASTLVLLGAGDDWLVSCDGHAHPHKALGLLCGGRPSYLAALLGLLMALLFAARVVRRKELRLRFQSVVRPRYFRVKAAYLESLLDGPREGAAAALAALLAHLALRVAGLAQASLLPSAADAVGLVAAAAWCRVAWLAGARVAQSICGQPIPVEGPATAAAAALLGAAPPTDHPVLLHLLLQHWAAATRWPAHRAALFRDATGAALGHVVRSCTAIVDAFARDIAEKPPQAATAPAPAPAVAAPRPAGAGGIAPTSPSKAPGAKAAAVAAGGSGPGSALRSPREAFDAFAHKMRLGLALARWPLVSWAAQTLANVAAASRREDELGLLQNAGSLPQVISSLVACRQAADGHASRVAASGAALRQQVVEGGTPAADLKALLMELDLSLYKIAAEFGPHISKIPLPKPVATELEAFARFEK